MAESATASDRINDALGLGLTADDAGDTVETPDAPETPDEPGEELSELNPDEPEAESEDDPEPAEEPEDEPEDDDLFDLHSSPWFAAAVEAGMPRGTVERQFKSDRFGTLLQLRDRFGGTAAPSAPAAKPDAPAPLVGGLKVDDILKGLAANGEFDEDQTAALKGALKPLVEAVNAVTQTNQKMRTDADKASEVRALQEQVSTAEAMFSKVDPDGGLFGYGKGDSVSLQSKDRKAFAQRTKVFGLGRVLNQAGYPLGEAMELAHEAVNAKRARELARKDIEDQLEKGTRGRTVPPSASRTQQKGPSEASLVTAINSAMGF